MSVRHRLTGSRIELADAGCLYWARPDVPLPARTETAASALGSATHEAAQVAGEAMGSVSDDDLEDVLRFAVGAVPADTITLAAISAKWGLTASQYEALAELHATWAAWWRDFVPDGAIVRYEVPYAWNTRTWTARELPSKGARDYSAATWDEVTCTIDAVICEPCDVCGKTGIDCYATRDHGASSRVTVIDLKTGRRRHAPAGENAQLATGALCVAGVLSVSSVRVVLAKILPGVVFADEGTLDAAALDGRALQLAEHMSALPAAAPRPGSHCAALYCPALATCEGPRVLAKRAPELAAALSVRIETEEQAAAALGAVKPLEAFIGYLRGAAVEWANAHGGHVRMPDGRVMRRVPQTRRTVDLSRPGALAAITSRFGEKADELVQVKRSVSITALERAAADLGPKGRKRVEVEARRATVSEVMREVEATGALKVSTFEVWEESDPVLEAK